MQKQEFINYYKSNSYNLSIFENFWKEKTDKPWNQDLFNTFIQMTSNPFQDSKSILLQTIIIPYYKNKFEVTELRDKENNIIKILDEQVTKKD